ncbi:MAG: LuxR C-terminal-related transcriptional regulator [Dermatophilaceae bacterium]
MTGHGLSDMPERAGVVVASWDAALTAALVAALNVVGWSATAWSPAPATPSGPNAADRPAGVVLAADPQGRIPDLSWVRGDHGRRNVVAVGSLAAVSSLRRVVSRGLVAVLTIDQPFPDLVVEVDRALLRQEPPPPAALLSTRLREREREARRFAALTLREQDVLGALIAGHSPVEIAATGRASIATVRSQIQAILTKLGVSSQVAAIALAHRSCREERIVRHIRSHRQF